MPISPGVKHRRADKVNLKDIGFPKSTLRKKKPDWIRVKLSATNGNSKFTQVKKAIRNNNLHTVCEEALCPNLSECFSRGTATFMILGDVCTRRCSFCDVAFGRPLAPDENEPAKLAVTIKEMKLKYVVITSVDRDDLLDGGANQFCRCIENIRKYSPDTKIEILVPDFRGRMEKALQRIFNQPPDVFNHNLETVPRLYKQVKPGANYQHSILLLKEFKDNFPDIPTKSGLMVGLGESDEEIEEVMADLRSNNIDMLTIGQYLQPSKSHHPVIRFVEPAKFCYWQILGKKLGFRNVAAGAMVRSSYHADLQIQE